MAVTEKRSLDDVVHSCKHILMDIEGTTTSISFVKDTLFPYVRKNLESYVSSHWDEEEFKTVLTLLQDQAVEDKKAAVEGVVDIPTDGPIGDRQTAVVKSVLWQMDGDRKITALKKLQGHMWREGYKTGQLKGHLFSDVAPALKDWVKGGRKLYVYSSGSVEAQKLLFGNSIEGDLIQLFSDFFDTEVGAKVDVGSYTSIVKKLDCSAHDVLFLTDLPKEASAARQAGLPVVLLRREGNEPIDAEFQKEFTSVSSFGEISFETSSKKLKVDEEPKSGEETKSNGSDITETIVSNTEVIPESSPNVSTPMDVEQPADASTVLPQKETPMEEDVPTSETKDVVSSVEGVETEKNSKMSDQAVSEITLVTESEPTEKSGKVPDESNKDAKETVVNVASDIDGEKDSEKAVTTKDTNEAKAEEGSSDKEPVSITGEKSDEAKVSGETEILTDSKEEQTEKTGNIDIELKTEAKEMHDTENTEPKTKVKEIDDTENSEPKTEVKEMDDTKNTELKTEVKKIDDTEITERKTEVEKMDDMETTESKTEVEKTDITGVQPAKEVSKTEKAEISKEDSETEKANAVVDNVDVKEDVSGVSNGTEEKGKPVEEANVKPENASVKPEETSIKPEETSIKPEETSAKPAETNGTTEETNGTTEETNGTTEETNGKAEETNGKAEEINGKSEESNGTNGAEENGHKVATEVSEVIVGKTVPQVDKPVMESEVAVEA